MASNVDLQLISIRITVFFREIYIINRDFINISDSYRRVINKEVTILSNNHRKIKSISL
jgi:hypothetical protein